MRDESLDLNAMPIILRMPDHSGCYHYWFMRASKNYPSFICTGDTPYRDLYRDADMVQGPEGLIKARPVDRI